MPARSFASYACWPPLPPPSPRPRFPSPPPPPPPSPLPTQYYNTNPPTVCIKNSYTTYITNHRQPRFTQKTKGRDGVVTEPELVLEPRFVFFSLHSLFSVPPGARFCKQKQTVVLRPNDFFS